MNHFHDILCAGCSCLTATFSQQLWVVVLGHNLPGWGKHYYFSDVHVPQEKPEPIDSKPRPSPSDQDHFSVYQSELFLDTDLVVKLKMAGQGTNTSNVIGQNKSDPTKVILELSINLATDVFPPFNLQRFSVSIDFRKTKEQLCLAK